MLKLYYHVGVKVLKEGKAREKETASSDHDQLVTKIDG